MAMPLFLFLCEGVADAHARANARNAVVDLSNINPKLGKLND